MNKDPRVYLAHILECAQRIERYTKGGEKEFLNESLIQDAVIRNFEVIGEAVVRLPSVCRQHIAESTSSLIGVLWPADQTRVRIYANYAFYAFRRSLMVVA